MLSFETTCPYNFANIPVNIPTNILKIDILKSMQKGLLKNGQDGIFRKPKNTQKNSLSIGIPENESI